MIETLKAIESEDLSRRAKLNIIIENSRELRCYVANLLSGMDKIDETLCFYKSECDAGRLEKEATNCLHQKS